MYHFCMFFLLNTLRRALSSSPLHHPHHHRPPWSEWCSSCSRPCRPMCRPVRHSPRDSPEHHSAPGYLNLDTNIGFWFCFILYGSEIKSAGQFIAFIFQQGTLRSLYSNEITVSNPVLVTGLQRNKPLHPSRPAVTWPPTHTNISALQRKWCHI